MPDKRQRAAESPLYLEALLRESGSATGGV
jgi:hypothetical protein